MQVFLQLLDARGQVVTRADLFDNVWGGAIVGDDSLNRAVAQVRRVVAQVAAGMLEVETIPRTGYRLAGDAIDEATGYAAADNSGRVSRRLVVGGALAVVGGAGAGLWWLSDRREQREFTQAMAQGQAVLEYGAKTDEAATWFRRSLEIRPGDDRAMGLLAYSLATRLDDRQSGPASAAVEEAQTAMRAALQSNATEPHARLAQILLQRSSLDLAGNEDQLRGVLAGDPDNIHVMRNLWNLLHCAGRSREALRLVERAMAVSPLAASNHYPMAQLLWILGRDAEANRVIDRALQYWPAHQWVRFARFTIFVFTGREQAALAMLNGKNTAPQNYSPEAIALWRVSLAALEDRSPPKVAAARDTNLAAAKRNLRLSAQAIMTLSALGEIDAAFDIADTVLLFRVPTHAVGPAGEQRPGKSTAWVFAPWLFTPPLESMRADVRFRTLCDGIGLSDYWSRRRVRPDFPIGGG
jgi:tetratricopeptide (TPR) repeat protein